MSSGWNIGVIGGDGIGPEVVEQAIRVVDALLGRGAVTWDRLPWSADHTLETGVTIADGEFDRFAREYDAVFLGALGDPRIPDMRHGRDILLGARFELDLYVNLRPARLVHPSMTRLKGLDAGAVDLVMYRENTEGLYVGLGGTVRRGTPDEVATSTCLATRKGTERIIRAAFEAAERRPRKTLTLCAKHNAVPAAHGLWKRVFDEVTSDYPGVTAQTLYADVAAMELVREPERFDVMVAPNLLGDVLSDLAAQVVGGLGLAPSANLNPGATSLFEPVHGSAPDIAGQGVANPFAAILTAGLMVDELGASDAARRLEAAVDACVAAGEATRDLGGSMGTVQAADAVIARL